LIKKINKLRLLVFFMAVQPGCAAAPNPQTNKLAEPHLFISFPFSIPKKTEIALHEFICFVLYL